MIKRWKRFGALLLTVAMLVGILPTPVVAVSSAAPEQIDANKTLVSPGEAPAELAEDEYVSKTEDGHGLGHRSAFSGQSITSADPSKRERRSVGSLPSSYNTTAAERISHGITPVRDQGSYGTCWAHAALASVEAYMVKHGIKFGLSGQSKTTPTVSGTTSSNINLSEYHTAWYSFTNAYDKLGMLDGDLTKPLRNYYPDQSYFLDCGGNGAMASYTLMRWEGVVDEGITPATAYSNANPSGLGSAYAYNYNVAHVQDCIWIPTSERDNVKRAIMDYGAGTFTFYSNDDYLNGSSYYCDEDVITNHDVTVVGWDDNYSRTNFWPQPYGNGAWIVKNSWGMSNGDDGYLYISYYDVPSSSAICYFYAAEDVDNYDNNYQYDGTSFWSYVQPVYRNDSIANVFTANGNETVEAVSVALDSADTTVRIDVYKNPYTDEPSSGTKMSSQTVSWDYAGYHTVKLETPFSVSRGDTFSVVVTNVSFGTVDFLFDDSGEDGWLYWEHSFHNNSSYFGSNSSWLDVSDKNNYRIKAYTSDKTGGGSSVTVERTVACERTIDLPDRVVNLYWNPTDTERATYFDYGPIVFSNVYAEMSDGSVMYCVSVNHQGTDTLMWLKQESDMVVTINHTYGEILWKTEHPHKGYRQCECGDRYYTGDTTTFADCSDCKSGAYLVADASKIFLALNGKNTQTVTISCEGDLPSKFYLQYIAYSDCFTCECGSWEGNSLKFTFTGKKAGTDTFIVWLIDSTNNDAVLYQLDLPVEVVANHTHRYTTNVTQPTCAEQGYTTYTCACGDSYTGDYVDALGHKWDDGVVSKEPTADSAGIITFTCTVCSATKEEFFGDPNKPFIDVHEDDYFFQPVLWAVSEEITNGTSPFTFSPHDTCTRAQAVTFLWRANGCPRPTKAGNPFKDVQAGMYYYTAVLWAVEKGITNGTSPTTFEPDATCTRGQIVTFQWRAAGQPTPSRRSNPFNDVSKSDYYYAPILWAVENGITNGTSKTTFGPNDDCTRGHIVTFLYRQLA